MTLIEGQKRSRGLAAPSPVNAMPELATIAQSAQKYEESSEADNTTLAYGKQWDAFAAWCLSKERSDLPAAPETLCLYLAACADAGLSVATLGVAKAAITQRHEKAGHSSPCNAPGVKAVWKGIRRRLGVAPNQKHPLDADQLRAMYAVLPSGILGVRDRALIGLGFAGGFRRSELVALDVPHLTFVRAGLEAFVRSSKTDKEGRGLTKVIASTTDPTACTVRAVRDWLELAGITEGPVFRPVDRHGNVSAKRLSDHAVATVLKRSAAAAGFSVEEISGHSLRAGFVTSAKIHGADDAAIMDQTGHTSLNMLQRYHRRAKKWVKPASEKLGL